MTAPNYLVDRLNARKVWNGPGDRVDQGLRNPDGPEAIARIAALEGALEPFAREAEDWGDKMDCEEIPADATDIKIGDLRNARNVLRGG